MNQLIWAKNSAPAAKRAKFTGGAGLIIVLALFVFGVGLVVAWQMPRFCGERDLTIRNGDSNQKRWRYSRYTIIQCYTMLYRNTMLYRAIQGLYYLYITINILIGWIGITVNSHDPLREFCLEPTAMPLNQCQTRVFFGRKLVQGDGWEIPYSSGPMAQYWWKLQKLQIFFTLKKPWCWLVKADHLPRVFWTVMAHDVWRCDVAWKLTVLSTLICYRMMIPV